MTTDRKRVIHQTKMTFLQIKRRTNGVTAPTPAPTTHEIRLMHFSYIQSRCWCKSLQCLQHSPKGHTLVPLGATERATIVQMLVISNAIKCTQMCDNILVSVASSRVWLMEWRRCGMKRLLWEKWARGWLEWYMRIYKYWLWWHFCNATTTTTTTSQFPFSFSQLSVFPSVWLHKSYDKSICFVHHRPVVLSVFRIPFSLFFDRCRVVNSFPVYKPNIAMNRETE